MAARKDPRNRDSSNKLAGATQLLNRLIKHANGELELSATQINAAKIVIGKYIPDLKSVEHSGDMTIRSLSQELAGLNAAIK